MTGGVQGVVEGAPKDQEDLQGIHAGQVRTQIRTKIIKLRKKGKSLVWIISQRMMI